MLAFTEILKNQMPKKKKKHKKLRHTLAEKVLDILLIIISVYIALFVESWAEKRHDEKRLHQYYVSIVGELNQDISDLKTMRNDALKHTGNCKRQIALIKGNPPKDTILLYLSKMYNSQLFANSHMLSYKSMIASGDFKLVEKLKVREALVELDAAYAAIKIQEDLYLDYITKDLSNYIVQNFDMIDLKPIDPKFYRKIKYKNLVMVFQGQNQARLTQYESSLKVAEKALKVLKEEING